MANKQGKVESFIFDLAQIQLYSENYFPARRA